MLTKINNSMIPNIIADFIKIVPTKNKVSGGYWGAKLLALDSKNEIIYDRIIDKFTIDSKDTIQVEFEKEAICLWTDSLFGKLIFRPSDAPVIRVI